MTHPLEKLTQLLEALPPDQVRLVLGPDPETLVFSPASDSPFTHLTGLAWPLGVAGRSHEKVEQVLGVSYSWQIGFMDAVEDDPSISLKLQGVDIAEYRIGYQAYLQWYASDGLRLEYRLCGRGDDLMVSKFGTAQIRLTF